MISSLEELARVLGPTVATIRTVARRAGGLYAPFDMRPVRGAGKWRHIDNPREDLKSLQRRIHDTILLPRLDGLSLSGRSIKDNAQPHTNQRAVVTVDIKECFAHITNTQVFAVFRGMLGFPVPVARILTQLTTLHGSLPQGAPSSPALADLVLLPLRADVDRIARSLGLGVSMWVDDIALSGRRARDAIGPIIEAVGRRGHSVRRSKIKISSARVEQVVTGVAVNAGLAAPRALVARIREELSVMEALGEVTDHELRSVDGRIAHVAMLNALQAEELRSLRAGLGRPVSGAMRKPPGETRKCSGHRRHSRAVGVLGRALAL